MDKKNKAVVWFASLLLFGLSTRVLLFPISAQSMTGFVTFSGESGGSVLMFLLGLALAGILIFFVVQKETMPELPEELREDWDQLSDLEREITKIK